MKKYMVVYNIDGENGASFYDNYGDAEKTRQDIECGLGGFVEIYERFSNKYGSYYAPLY